MRVKIDRKAVLRDFGSLARLAKHLDLEYGVVNDLVQRPRSYFYSKGKSFDAFAKIRDAGYAMVVDDEVEVANDSAS